MEQHPVPRNISSFQFHLIGDMTLRQLVYLAAGAVTGYLFFRSAPFPSIVSIPIAAVIGFTGFAFAFLPIQERPLDKWLVSFIKSILSPTQYLWHKENIPPDILTRVASVYVPVRSQAHIETHHEARQKLNAYLASLPSLPHEVLNLQEKNYVEKTMSLFGTSAVVVPPVPTQTFSQPSPQTATGVSAAVAMPAVFAQKPVLTAQDPKKTPPVTAQISSTSPQISTAEKNRPVMQKQLEDLSAEKQALLKELENLRSEYNKLNQSKSSTPAQAAVNQKQPAVKIVSAKVTAEELGMPKMPQAANIISGVLKDPQRKLLPNIIITIKDKSGLPLRALKTNKLGQFATATPLSNGTYLLEVEDPLKRFVFNTLEISLSGKILMPVEIIARGERELTREKLTKELFGSANT